MTKIYLATPSYDGKVTIPYALSLGHTACLMNSLGIAVEVQVNYGSALVVTERNRIMMKFLESDATHLLCIDADIGWPAQAVKNLLDCDLDICAGLYPCRQKKGYICKPSLNPDGSMIKKDNLFKMDYIPAGFMLIKRNVIEKLIENYSHLYYETLDDNQKKQGCYAIFNTELFEGDFWGEDYVFSRRVRECGYEIWIDPFIEFDHNGVKGAFIQELLMPHNGSSS
jgi:hypothetical protein